MKFLKKLVFLMIFAAFMGTTIYAHTMDIRVVVDGKIIESVENKDNNQATGFASNNRTYVPLRLIGETLNCKVHYDPVTKNIRINGGDTNIVMNVYSKDFTVNGENRSMDVNPIIYKNRTYIPIRFIGEAFNQKVDWHQASFTCVVGKTGNINLNGLKKLTVAKAYEVIHFGNPKVTIQVPKDLMKEISIKRDKNDMIESVYFHEKIGAKNPNRLYGELFSISQAYFQPGEGPEDNNIGAEREIDWQGNAYTFLDQLWYPNGFDEKEEAACRKRVETPHYKNLRDRLKKEIIVTVEKK